MKKIIFSLFLAVCALLLFVFVNIRSQKAYKLIPVKNIELLSTIIQDPDETYIYFGCPTCPDCVNFKPILEKELKLAKVNAYYFNTDVFRGDSKYNDVIQMYDVEWVPSFYKVGGGSVIEKFDLQLERNPDENAIKHCGLQLNKFLFSIKGLDLCLRY